MQKIKKLSQHDIIKIAAGEVVERPANALKELIENSIDAGATQITVHLKQGGKELIEITDNGCGMSQEDALISFLPHTTSKINSIDDLESVASFGFRGEALASMAAVSKLAIVTNNGSLESTKLVIENGSLISQTVASHAQGTTICIQNLFAFLPARKKFLKKDETELHACTQIFQAFCLAYPHIHFKLFHNDTLLVNCLTTDNILTRVQQVWPNVPASQLHTINTSHDAVQICGVTSNPQYQKYDRSCMYVFVNQRFVKNQHLLKAILKGYQGILPPQKFPVTVLQITVPQASIDVNIHPKKEEILFTHPHSIDKQITHSIQETISALHTPAIQTPETQAPFDQEPVIQKASYNFQSTEKYTHSLPETMFVTKTEPFIFEKNIQKKAEQKNISEQESIFTHKNNFEYTLIGQYNTTYILIQKEHDLILIDQHAAHERILYEQYKASTQPQPSVRLLFPHIINTTQQEADRLEPHFGLFTRHGITLERFSDTQLCLYATPIGTKNEQLTDIIQACLALAHQTDIENKIHETLYAQIACASAIKAGQELTQETMHSLIEQLMTTPNYQTCPHGRPTHIAFFEKDITKYFKRDYTHKKIDYEHNIL